MEFGPKCKMHKNARTHTHTEEQPGEVDTVAGENDMQVLTKEI